MQASRSWNNHFDSVIKAYGFIQTFGEACIYKKVSGSSVGFLILYVDHILLIENNVDFLKSIKECLKRVFQRKTSMKLLTYWASRSVEIDQDAWYIFNEYIPWQDFEVVQNGKVKEGVLACVARCEVE